MANEIGTAYVGVELDPSGVQKGLGGIQGQLQQQLGPLGGLISGALVTPWTAAAAAAVGGAVIIGKALYNIGSEFDAMADEIQTSTGATGKELDALVDGATEVAKRVPVSFEDAGKAISKLEQRTDLTGRALEDLTATTLQLAKVTGQDLGQVLESSTRLFGDWGLAGAESAEGLDQVFRASQETGTEVTRLMDLMTKFGGPMRQLGFDFTEAASLLGKFEAEGVNTELVMGSMRIALGKFAKEGKEPAEALAQITAEIKNAGSAGEANTKAMELFGRRAGADMAAAIREGRFEVEDLFEAVKNGQSTIDEAERGTRDFAESWLITKNVLKDAVEPAASAVFSAVADGMQVLARELPPIIARLKRELGPAFEDIAVAVKELAPLFKALGPVLVVAFAGTILVVKNLAAAIRLIATVIAETVKLVKAVLTGDWAGAWKAAQNIVGAFEKYARSVIGNYLGYLKSVTSLHRAAAAALGKAIVSGFQAGVSGLGRVAQAAVNAVRSAVSGAAGAAYSAAVAIGRAIVNGALSGIAGLGSAIKNAAEGQIRDGLSKLNPFSPVEKGGELYIGEPIMRGATAGIVKGQADLSQALAQVVTKAVEAGRRQIEAGRAGFQESWGRMAGDALTAFDAITGGMQTKTEKLLASLDLKRQTEDLARAVVEAKDELARAMAEGDPTAIAAAQRRVDDALFAQRRVALERQAAEERKQLDARNTLRRRNFEDALAELQRNLEREGATAAQALKRTTALMKRYGVDFKDAGDVLGTAFAKGMKVSLNEAAEDALRILKRIKDAIADVQRASSQVKAPAAPKTGTQVAQAAGLMAAPNPLGGGGGGGLAGPVPLGQKLMRLSGYQTAADEAPTYEPEVRVFIGDTELRGLVRTEVVDANTGLARTLLAGARA